MKIALIPSAATEWHADGRLLGRVGLPMTEAGQQQCSAWVAVLRPLELQRLLHGPDDLTRQTAELLGRQLEIPTKALDELAEVDLGLWAGLTEAQLKTRFASAHRELRESPLHVNPPGGEALSQATERLTTCIRKQLRKNGAAPFGVVLRPLGFALVQHVLGNGRPTDLWEAARGQSGPVIIEPPVTPRPGSKHG